MDQRRNPIPSDAVVVSDDTDGIFAVDVEIKVARLDTEEITSEGKVFKVNGRKHPMSRFGSWVFQEGDSDHEKQVCIDGGIIASLTWGLQQICPQIDVWVKDVKGNSFSLQMKVREKRSILEQIAKGNLAKDLETILRERIPTIYANVRIILVRILGKSTRNPAKSNASSSGEDFLSRVAILHELECISHLMSSENFGLAYMSLKKFVDSKISDLERIQVLLRLGTCCFHLEKTDEMKDTAVRVLRLIGSMANSAPPMDAFVEDISIFAEHLGNSGMFTYAADIMLGCNKIIHEIEDPNKLLSELLTNVMMCCTLLKSALRGNGMLGLREEYRSYIQKLDKEVQFIKGLKECDQLGQARAVYYSLHMMNGIRELLGEPVSTTPQVLAGSRFSCTESAWADLTTVLSLGDRIPEIAVMFSNRSFMKIVKDISDNPALLEKRILDPRILQINAILNQDFYKQHL